MSRFIIKDTLIQGLKIIERKPIGDSRGFFERFFCINDLEAVLDKKKVVQINRSMTANKETVRGLHFQYQQLKEKKIVSCTKGKIFDVAVDIRKGSPTFLSWHGEILSEDNHKTLLVPEGFAHGYQIIDDYSEVMYISTASYNHKKESGLNPKDPTLAITWPELITELSLKDKQCPFIKNSFEGISI